MTIDPDTRPDPPPSAGPVEMISAYLDFHRATMLWKLSGLSHEDLVKSRTESGWSLLGVMKHSAYVERWWFQTEFAGNDVWYPWTDEFSDADWQIEPNETPEHIFALYRQECEESRRIVAGQAWDAPAKGTRAAERGQTLGWIIGHMLEEVARHNGQIDIVRESIDGLTGE
jgi:uncharacterized damage-inducible protein DinB